MISPAAPSFAQLRGNMASTRETSPRSSQKVVVIMPAYNAAKTLRMTYTALPHDRVDLVPPPRQAAGHLVMVERAMQGLGDVVLGSRLMSVSPVAQGMPWWKYIGNRLLTKVENAAFGLHLSEYHTGYRAFSREVLETINFQMNADGFIFDQEVIAQIVDARFRVAEVSVPTRYFPEASSASFIDSSRYGLGILWLVFRYGLHRSNLLRQNKFQSLKRRYSKVERSSTGSEDG